MAGYINDKIAGMNVRYPAFAGSFYPSNQSELNKFLDMVPDKHCSNDSNKTFSGRVRALISPHAGYVYSGSTAARGYECIKDRDYENVIVFAPSHRIPFFGIALSDYTHYRTPLGDIAINRDAVDDILKNAHGFSLVRNDAHDREHALEVQLPFIQKVLPEVPLIPVICGHIDDYSLVAEAFAKYKNDKNLWIISSDFTHYGADFQYTPFSKDLDESIESLDMQAIEKILNIDPEGFLKFIKTTGATICGAGPISILLHSLYHSKDIQKTLLLDYTNSGKLMSDFSHSVSYASIAFLS